MYISSLQVINIALTEICELKDHHSCASRHHLLYNITMAASIYQYLHTRMH